jgi:hypothetical protein
LHPLDAVQMEHDLRDAVDDEHVGRVTQVVIGFEHEQLGVHPCLGEVPLGGRHGDIRRHVFRRVLLVVVCGTYVNRLTKPMMAITAVTAMIGTGQRTTIVPTLRQPRVGRHRRQRRHDGVRLPYRLRSFRVAARLVAMAVSYAGRLVAITTDRPEGLI